MLTQCSNGFTFGFFFLLIIFRIYAPVPSFYNIGYIMKQSSTHIVCKCHNIGKYTTLTHSMTLMFTRLED